MKFFILLAGLLLNNVVVVPDADITVSVNGISSDNGTIYINLYTSDTGFPTDMTKAVKTIRLPAAKPAMQYVFKNLPKGVYAISVMHDENNNGKMDTNFFDIPTEGYCVSNNVKGFMSAPSFVDAEFEVKDNVTLNLKLIY